jgi:hypothetical protein
MCKTLSSLSSRGYVRVKFVRLVTKGKSMLSNTKVKPTKELPRHGKHSSGGECNCNTVIFNA